MSVLNDKEIEQTWGSHQPVLKAFIQTLSPQTVVECGCGNFSTPHLKAVPFLHTIEHDFAWGRKMMSQFPPDQSHKWTIDPLNVKNSTCIKELPSDEREYIRTCYKEMADEVDCIDLLFMDTFPVCRVEALLKLAPRCKVAIVHDLEPPGLEWYGWDGVNELFQPWHRYICKPPGVIGPRNQTIPWTALISTTPIDLDAFNEAMKEESNRLWGFDAILEPVPEGKQLYD